MVDGGPGALSVEKVKQRFAEAEALLDQAAGRVDAVALAAETRQSSTAALAEAASAIGEAAAQHRASIVAVQDALAVSARSLEVASTFLANTDVSRLTSNVADLVDRIGTLETTFVLGQQEQAAAINRMSALVDALAYKVDHTEELTNQRDAAVARLNQVMNVVPARLRKRLGAKH
jgi:hypothetical protein